MSVDGFSAPKEPSVGEQNRRLKEASDRMADAVAQKAAERDAKLDRIIELLEEVLKRLSQA